MHNLHWILNHPNHQNHHIIFVKDPDTENQKHLTLSSYNSRMEVQTLSLFKTSYQNEIFELIPRSFTITTNNNVAHKFNIDLLKATSPIITGLLDINTDKTEYQLNITDDQDVLSKFEQMYLGKKVIFTENELPTAKEITGNLNIVYCPNYLKPNFMKLTENTKQDLNSGIGISLDHSNDFFKQIEYKIFTIVTNKKEYKCNIFAVYSSKIIRDFIQNNPNNYKFVYNFDDNFDEFQPICDILNFKPIIVNVNNMDSLKDIIDDLQISYLADQINNYVNQYDKISQSIDENQSEIDSIEKLFDLLYNIKKYTIEAVKESIVDSEWSKTEDNVQELAAFILQVIRSDFIYHSDMIELLIQLDKEANENNYLEILLPFMLNKLIFFLGESNINCSIVYNLYKKGLISKEQLLNKISNVLDEKHTNNYNSTHEFLLRATITDIPTVNYVSLYSWFLPEIVEMNRYENDFNTFDSSFSSFIQAYYPDNIEGFKTMRDNGEPTDLLTKALRSDDVDSLQSILARSGFQEKNTQQQQQPTPRRYFGFQKKENDVLNFNVPFNIFEDFVPNGSTKYIDYAAAYGSIKCFKYLLLNHAEVNETTFRLAVYGGNIEIIKIVDQKTNKSSKSYIYSMQSSYYKNSTEKEFPSIIKHQNDLFDWILQEKYLKNNYLNDIKEMLLKSSASNGNAHSMIELIDKGSDYLNILLDLIEISAKNGFYHLAQILHNLLSVRNENENKNDKFFYRRTFFNSTPFVSFGNLSIFKLYASESKNASEYENALKLAVKRDYTSIINFYFKTAAENNFKAAPDTVFNCLSTSISKNDENKTFKYLLEQFKLNNESVFQEFTKFNELISKACYSANVEITEIITNIILENTKDIFNFTVPFFNAALSGSFEICQFLIDKKVFINYEKLSSQVTKLSTINAKIFSLIVDNADNESKRILLNCYLEPAINKGNKELIEYLYQNNAKSEDALIKAISSNDLDMVNIILKYNSDPSFINRKSNGTPLIVAVKKNNLEIVNRLLSIPGIDPNLYESGNKTPLLIAISQLNLEITNAILEFYGESIKSQSWQLNKALKMALKMISSKSEFGKCSSNPGWGMRPINPIQTTPKKTAILSIVKRLLKTNCLDYNIRAGDYTILSYACEINDIEIVQMLLNSGKVDVNLYSPGTGDTPLITAIGKKNIEIAKILIEYPSTNINMRNYLDQSALTIAVEQKLDTIINLLINNEKLNSDEIGLNFAFYIADAETSKLLISAPNLDVNYKLSRDNSNSSKNQVYYLSSSNFERTLGKNKDYYKPEEINAYKTTLIEAIYSKDVDKIDLIIQHPSFDKDKSLLRKALFISVMNKDETIFKKLLNLIEDVNIYGINNDSLLRMAVKEGNKEIVSEILQSSSFDSKRSDILSSFIDTYTNKNVEMIKIMEELCEYDQNHDKFIDFNQLLPNGKSFFTSIGIYKKNKEENNYRIEHPDLQNVVEIATFFINHGVDVNKPDSNGFYPLEYAIILNSIEFVRVLLDSNKIDLNQKIETKTEFYFILAEKEEEALSEDDAKYKSYLHLAAGSKNVEILNEFLKRKLIDVNIVDDLDQTPLMDAIRFNIIANVKALFKCDDLDYLHKNSDGEDALELCASFFDKKVNEDVRTKQGFLHKIVSLMFEEEEEEEEFPEDLIHGGGFFINDSDASSFNEDDDDDEPIEVD